MSKRPELRDRPLVLEATSPRGQRVVACSSAAVKLGIAPGMLAAEAAAIRNTDLLREQHHPEADRRSLEKLASWCHRFSPSIGLEEAVELDTLLLDATNLAPLYGGEQSLVDQVTQGLARLNLEAHVALAGNIATAWAAAHYQEISSLSPLGERVRVRGHVVPPGENLAALRPLPACALRLDELVVDTLARLGIQTVGELLALPRDSLASRLGSEVLRRIHQAIGDQPEVIRAVPHSEKLVAQWLFEPPITKWTQINKVIERLLGQLTHQLAVRDAGALVVVCQIECELGEDVRFETRLFCPTSDAAHLMEIVGLRTERLLLTSPVTAVKVHIVRHAPLSRQQRVLFEREAPWQHSTHVAGLIDRVAGRLGADAAVRYRLKREAQAEFAYTEHSLVGNLATRKRRATKTVAEGELALAPLDRPLRFFARPVKLETLAFLHEGPPIRFVLEGQQHIVAHHRGPERIETGWWRRRGVRRDYYRVETTTGHRFWLFRCLRRQAWFLQGAFE